MERQAAMQLLNTLAQGIDPHSGESFPADSPYQHPDTVRALQPKDQLAARKLIAARARPSRHGWSAWARSSRRPTCRVIAWGCRQPRRPSRHPGTAPPPSHQPKEACPCKN